MSETLNHTPLYAAHTKLNARTVDFAGWAMPVMYAGILEEARAVRTSVGIFDISHMGRVQVSGTGATAFLQSITSNNVEKLTPPQAQYSLLTNPEGGIKTPAKSPFFATPMFSSVIISPEFNQKCLASWNIN